MSGWDLGLYCAVRGKYQWSGDYVLGLLRKYNLRASKSRQEDFGKAIKLWKLALKATPDALQGAMELMNIKSERSMKIWENRIDAAMSGIDHGDSIRAARALLNALDAQRRTK